MVDNIGFQFPEHFVVHQVDITRSNNIVDYQLAKQQSDSPVNVAGVAPAYDSEDSTAKTVVTGLPVVGKGNLEDELYDLHNTMYQKMREGKSRDAKMIATKVLGGFAQLNSYDSLYLKSIDLVDRLISYDNDALEKLEIKDSIAYSMLAFYDVAKATDEKITDAFAGVIPKLSKELTPGLIESFAKEIVEKYNAVIALEELEEIKEGFMRSDLLVYINQAAVGNLRAVSPSLMFQDIARQGEIKDNLEASLTLERESIKDTTRLLGKEMGLKLDAISEKEGWYEKFREEHKNLLSAETSVLNYKWAVAVVLGFSSVAVFEMFNFRNSLIENSNTQYSLIESVNRDLKKQIASFELESLVPKNHMKTY